MKFVYQEWAKYESERAIINSLFKENKRFGEITKETMISKPVLIKRLRELEKQGKIERVPEPKTKSFPYHLNPEKINNQDKIGWKIHQLSEFYVNMITELAKDNTVKQEKFYEAYENIMQKLFFLKMSQYSFAPPEIAGEWLKNTLGLETVRNLKDFLLTPRIVKIALDPKEPAIDVTKEEQEDSFLESLDKEIEILNDAKKQLTKK